MVTLQHILRAVDRWDALRRARSYALALWRLHDAVHVIQVVDVEGWQGMCVEGIDTSMTGEAGASLEEQLGWSVARGIGGGAGASIEPRGGVPRDAPCPVLTVRALPGLA
jgi:hypothetical protein